MARIAKRRQRFDAFAFDGQHQPSRVMRESLTTVVMPQPITQRAHVAIELSKVGHGVSARLLGADDHAMSFVTQ